MCPSKLDPYRAKRNPAKTPEPVPPVRAEPASRAKKTKKTKNAPSFVIQEHHASSLHWDFRLERDGVLVSWALPKGLPFDPKRNHLAVHVEDHPLEYGSFQGQIPSGEYGGGKVSIWDRGEYEVEKWSDREVMVRLHGTRAQGRYVLFATGATDSKSWMIHRMDPAPEGFEALPKDIEPMLARTGALPAPGEWIFEFKWDGVRAIAVIDGGRTRLTSRNGNDITATYPELRALGDELGSRSAVLDGEIVALDDQGRPSFKVLQQRMHVSDASRARRLAAETPATYLVFDLLHLDDHSTMDLPYRERRRLLDSLELKGPSWATPPVFDGADGQVILDAASERGLEGVVAKRAQGTYTPGRRSEDWIKVKNFRTQEVIVGGFSPGKGNRAGTIGALLLGVNSDEGLDYVGKVGTGFTDELLRDLSRRLARLKRATSPFVGVLPKAETADATWVRPSLVGEVQFSEWTNAGRLRQPSWRGLRPDKKPADVRREP